MAAFILHRQGSSVKAKDILDEALSRAPDSKRNALMLFQKKLLADIEDLPRAPLPSSQENPEGSYDSARERLLKLRNRLDRQHGAIMQAATQGDPTAMVDAGYSCYLGQDGEVDYENAVLWYRKAAALGNPKTITQSRRHRVDLNEA